VAASLKAEKITSLSPDRGTLTNKSAHTYLPTVNRNTTFKYLKNEDGVNDWTPHINFTIIHS